MNQVKSLFFTPNYWIITRSGSTLNAAEREDFFGGTE